MKHSTPIISAVRRMHDDDDKRALCDPYNTLSRRDADKTAYSAAQAREAGDILACYETELTIKE